MSEVVETPSQPASNAADIMRETFADLAPEIESPQAPEVETPAEPSFDPATIRIPKLSDSAPKSLAKFQDKSLADVVTSYEEAERQMHAKAKEAAELLKQLEAERQARIAAEQFARMSRTPEVQKPHDPYAGLNPDEAIITQPRQVLDATLTEAERRAQVAARAEAERVRGEINAQLQKQMESAQLISAFELARADVSKLVNREVSVEEWQNELQDIARIVQARTPERTRDHNAYVETYVRLKGVPKTSVPSEGNAPISARPAMKSERAVPSMTREDQLMKKQIWKALKLNED